jgi:hypothetical protein
MKTAEEMRAISNESAKSLIKRIEAEMEVKAKDGASYHKYLVENYYTDGDVANAMTELKLNGYNVDLEASASDEFNCKMIINW